jgi:nicotinamidase/pyrazinamidase
MNRITLPPQNKIAAFDVDCQKTFTPECPDELPVPEGDEIVDELNANASKAGCRLGSKDAHSPDAIWVASDKQPAFTKLNYEQADMAWPKHAVPGTKGFELLDGLPRITSYDFFVWKGVEPNIHPYGACYHDLKETISTGVIEFLYHKGIKTVLVGGLATEHCVRVTCLQLLRAGFDLLINMQACRGIDPRACDETFQEIINRGGRIADNAQSLVARGQHDH